MTARSSRTASSSLLTESTWARQLVHALGPSDIRPRAPTISEVMMTAFERQLLTPGEVARLFRVDPKTVTRWAMEGKLTYIRTLGGHRRFKADDVFALLLEASDRSR